METKARVLQAQDCGSLLLARSRAPYVVGCLLPQSALRSAQWNKTMLEAKIVFPKGQAALELQVQVESGGSTYQMSYLVNHAAHEFLEGLREASALYLLTGFDHPVEYADLEQPHAKTLYQRVHEGGLAIEVTEAVRSQIFTLQHIHAAKPMSFVNEQSASGC